jgi:hypothetical protein
MILIFENSCVREYEVLANGRIYILKIYSSGIFLFYYDDETWHGHEVNGELLVNVKGIKVIPETPLMSMLQI